MAQRLALYTCSLLTPEAAAETVPQQQQAAPAASAQA
jgi:hypothetical protein